jgi:hypothetical protein
MRNATFGDERGVFVAPWVGPKGELVLIARRRDKRLAGDPYTIPLGSSHVLAADALWERLDRDDPEPALKVI